MRQTYKQRSIIILLRKQGVLYRRYEYTKIWLGTSQEETISIGHVPRNALSPPRCSNCYTKNGLTN